MSLFAEPAIVLASVNQIPTSNLPHLGAVIRLLELVDDHPEFTPDEIINLEAICALLTFAYLRVSGLPDRVARQTAIAALLALVDGDEVSDTVQIH
jgi:hypothetical protein